MTSYGDLANRQAAAEKTRQEQEEIAQLRAHREQSRKALAASVIDLWTKDEWAKVRESLIERMQGHLSQMLHPRTGQDEVIFLRGAISELLELTRLSENHDVELSAFVERLIRRRHQNP